MCKVILKEYQNDDEPRKTKVFDSIDECIDYLYDKDYFDDFDIDEEEIRDELTENNKYVFGGGYTSVHLTLNNNINNQLN